MLSTRKWGEVGRETKKGGDHEEQMIIFCSAYVVDTVSHSYFTHDE